MRFDGPAADMVRALAPERRARVRMAVANEWLFAPLLVRKIAATPAGAATLHTTIAPTMLRGSPKENVLPQDATAWINYRIAPGTPQPQVMERARSATQGLDVQLAWEGPAYDPPPVSSGDVAGVPADRDAGVRRRHVPVAPGPRHGHDRQPLARRHGARTSTASSRSSRRMRDFEMIHGTNEHMTLDNLRRMTGFYARLIATAAK